MPFYDLPTGMLENQTLRLEYLEQAGPRVVRLIYKPTGNNLLAEIPEVKLKSPRGEYAIHGGHRLWAAPESPGFTYIPDDSGLSIEKTQHGVILTGEIEVPTGLQKKMEIILDADSPEVHLKHSLINRGSEPVNCAAWAITVLPPGGKAILPLRPTDGSEFLPDRQICLWPYASFTDSRLEILDEEMRIKASPRQVPFKVGARCPQGWINYTNNGLCFRKEFFFDPDADYCDMGCNAEVYTNGTIIETESLSGMVRLPPGGSILHNEKWVIFETI